MLQNCSAGELKENYQSQSGTLVYGITTNARQTKPLESLSIVSDASLKSYRIQQYENGTVIVEVDGQAAPMSKPHLRDIATEIGVDTLNDNSNEKIQNSLVRIFSKYWVVEAKADLFLRDSWCLSKFTKGQRRLAAIVNAIISGDPTVTQYTRGNVLPVRR